MLHLKCSLVKDTTVIYVLQGVGDHGHVGWLHVNLVAFFGPLTSIVADGLSRRSELPLRDSGIKERPYWVQIYIEITVISVTRYVLRFGQKARERTQRVTVRIWKSKHTESA